MRSVKRFRVRRAKGVLGLTMVYLRSSTTTRTLDVKLKEMIQRQKGYTLSHLKWGMEGEGKNLSGLAN